MSHLEVPGAGVDGHGTKPVLENQDVPLNSGSGDGPRLYYGIFVPHSPGFSPEKNESRVYTDRNEALRTLKANKKARFKAFTDLQAAKDFSTNGCEIIAKVECPKIPGSPVAVQTENSNFKGPKSQELVKFRKSIENHDFALVKKFIEENPRFLVSSGDTPQILQEGSRYNALHVSARCNNPTAAKFICETIKSVSFMNKLYGGAHSNLLDRGSIMLDLYLNTPDKASNETPLHFASKLGALEVVRVLVSYEQCDRNRINKYGETARDLVCARASGQSADIGIKREILFALEEHFYVAVLRSPDNALAPTIPEPFKPNTPPVVLLSGSTPTKKSDVPMVISGVAGPMTASDATSFRKKWKTPPRNLVFDNRIVSPLKTDPDKGVERVGRALASDLHVQWKEYWSFLGQYINLSSTEGLTSLEQYLSSIVSDSNKEKDDTTQSSKKSVDNRSPLSPISDLCDNFKSLTIEDHRPKVPPHCLQNASTVFATRLALSLSRRSLQSSIQEMNKYQDFLVGCSNDTRFSLEDLSTAHSQLASLVYSKLSSQNGNSIVDFNSMLNDQNCSQGSVDRLKCVLNFIKQNTNGKAEPAKCDCLIKSTMNASRVLKSQGLKCNRNLNFSHFKSGDDAPELDSDDEDEDEFFTPPNSPARNQYQMSDDDDDFVNASDSPQIFIEGGQHPTKIDFDVYRTVSDVLPQLDAERFPMINYWSSCMSKHSPLPL